MKRYLAPLFAIFVVGSGIVSSASCDSGCEGLDLCSCVANPLCTVVPKAGTCGCGISGINGCPGYDGPLCACLGEYDHCEAASQGGW